MEESFRSFSKKYVGRIESFISEFYFEREQNARSELLRGIYSDIREYCLRPGKRIRPLMLLAGYCGYSFSEPDERHDEIVKLAAVLEIMHSFLLVHDDIIDKAELRRGKESMHVIHGKRYGMLTRNDSVGTDVSIITGDMMSFDCIGIIAESGISSEIKSSFLRVFSETYIYTTWGQILDIVSSMPREMNIDTSLPSEISLYKTAYYTISNPLIMGYVLGGGTEEKEILTIKDFSIPLGLCFQFRDDLIGTFGVDELTGKSSDSDIIEGKYTLLVDHALKFLSESDKRDFTEIFLKTVKSPEEILRIRKYIEKSGARNNALEHMERLGSESLNKLEGLEISVQMKRVLQDVVNNICGIAV